MQDNEIATKGRVSARWLDNARCDLRVSRFAKPGGHGPKPGDYDARSVESDGETRGNGESSFGKYHYADYRRGIHREHRGAGFHPPGSHCPWAERSEGRDAHSVVGRAGRGSDTGSRQGFR